MTQSLFNVSLDITGVSKTIGVVDTGTRTSDGMTLAYIDADFNVASKPTTAWFDSFAPYNFVDYTSGSDYFVDVPIAYWKRGVVPAGKQYAGNWYMMLSESPRADFAANPFVFKNSSGTVLDKIHYGKYRINTSNNSASGTTKASTTYTDFNTLIRNKGTGYHMVTLQEYHEILARAVIEKGTFQLWDTSARGTVGGSNYKGIVDMALGITSGVYIEWRDGIRTDSSNRYEVYPTPDATTWTNTGVTAPTNNAYITSLMTGPYFDWMFMAATMDSTNYIIPDYAYASLSRYCLVYFYSSSTYFGAFYSHVSYDAAHSDTSLGARLAKL